MSDKLNPIFPYKIEKAHWYLLLLWREEILSDEEFEHAMILLQNKLDNPERTVREVKTPVECVNNKINTLFKTFTMQTKLAQDYQRILYPDNVPSDFNKNKVLSIIPQESSLTHQVMATPYNNGIIAYSTQAIPSIDFLIIYYV